MRFPFYSTNVLFFFFIIILNFSEARIKLPEGVIVPPALLIFGDSIVDQGNNNNLQTTIKSNHSPYGKDFLGGTPTGRFTNGKTPVDFVGITF